MPKRIAVIPEVQKAVTRPLSIQVLRQVMLNAGVDPATPIRYQANGKSIPVAGSTLDPEAHPNRLLTDQQIFVNIVEDYNENFALSTAILRPNQPFVFEDPKLGIRMKPYYQNVASEMTVTFTASDSVLGEMWRRRVKLMASRGSLNHLHQADYHYVVPEALMSYLVEFYRLRNAQFGYGDDLQTWLNANFSNRYTIVGNMIGEGRVYTIREGQTDMLGWYEFGHNPPKFEQEDDSGAWSVTFTYKFNYDRVEGMVLEYPMMIHNQMLSEPYITLPTNNPTWYQYYTSPDDFNRVLDMWRWQTAQPWADWTVPGIAVPYYDDWFPKSIKPKFQHTLRLQLEVDPNNLRDILDLNQLGEWTFVPMVREYLALSPISITQLYESIFNVEIHRGIALESPRNLIVSNQLHITNLYDLDPRQSYHMVISMLLDPSLLSENALVRLARCGSFVKFYFCLLWPGMASYFPDDQGCTPIPVSRIKTLIEVLGKHIPMVSPNQLSTWWLVQNTTIQAFKEDRNANR